MSGLADGYCRVASIASVPLAMEIAPAAIADTTLEKLATESGHNYIQSAFPMSG